MKPTTLARRVVSSALAVASLCGCNATQGQVDNGELSVYVTPPDQVLRYKSFFGKVKLTIDENRLDEPLYLEQILELEIRGARPRTYATSPAKFPPGMIAYYEPNVAPNPPLFNYRSRRLILPDLNTAACIHYEFIEAIFGKGFKPPAYGQPHINWSPGSVPVKPTGTYAGLIGIFKEMKNSPVTQISLGFDFHGCADSFIIKQAIN